MISGPGVIPSGALCIGRGAEFPELLLKSKSNGSVKQLNIFFMVFGVSSGFTRTAEERRLFSRDSLRPGDQTQLMHLQEMRMSGNHADAEAVHPAL